MSQTRCGINYYEVMQISRNAEMDTIHRVYRIMAARFHPDNSITGNTERFLLLRRAYQILSDPVQRAQYDALSEANEDQPLPVFELQDFVDGVEVEKNRRVGVLSLLYLRRRMNEWQIGMSVLDLEKRMALPREYLTFTLWYLRSKGYLTVEENSDYSITASGVDYLEALSLHNSIARELIMPPAAKGNEEPGSYEVSQAA